MEIIVSIVVGGFLLVMALKFWRVTLVLGAVFLGVVAFEMFTLNSQQQGHYARPVACPKPHDWKVGDGADEAEVFPPPECW